MRSFWTVLVAVAGLAACAPERPPDARSSGRPVAATFLGRVDPVAGTVTLEPLPGDAGSALTSAAPGTFATVSVVQDGRPLQGPPGTVELRTLATGLVRGGCGAVNAFDAEVQLNSFVETFALHRPHVEILRVTPTGRESCASAPPPAPEVSDRFGLFAYDDVEPGGSATARWRFALPSSTGFTFVGRVVAEPVERTPPTTAASPAGGTFDAPVAVTLSCADAESGCAATYYRLGGGPVRLYAGPVTVPSSQALCFHSVDQADNAERPRCVSYSVSAAQAVYGATTRTPECAAPSSSCDTGSVLISGRGAMSGWTEPNQPNTLGGACADGSAGAIGVAESLDRLRVSSTDGGLLRAGRTARIEATVWAGAAYASDALDLYSTTSITPSATWTLVGTLVPPGPGQQALSTTFTLPASAARVAIRGQFRSGAGTLACSAGAYNDRDDLVFAVAPALDAVAPAVSITAPAARAAVGGVVPVSVTATDATGVVAVELLAGGARVGVDSQAPFAFSWDAHPFTGRNVQLRAVAWDAAGNRGVSAPVTVGVGDGTCASCPGGTLCTAGACRTVACAGTLALPGAPALAGDRIESYRAAEVADLNGDGRPDVAVASYTAGVVVFLGDGDGTFGAGTSYMAGYRPVDVAAGDVTRDGKRDLVVADSTGSRAVILPGRGDGTFDPAVDLTFSGGTTGVALADFNGDGRLDVAAALGTGIAVRRNGSTGFGAETRYSAAYVDNLVAVDLNRDGRPDLVGGSTRGSVVVLMNDGTGGFLPGAWYWGPDANLNVWVAAGDLDGDGDADVAIAQPYGVSVFLNDGTGILGQSPVVLRDEPATLGILSLGIAVADVDGDGVGDVIAADPNFTEGVAVYRGLGAGAFAPADLHLVGAPNHLAVADLDGDLRVDLVGAGGSLARVALNEGGAFASFRAYPLDVAATAVEVGDMDRNGKPDLVVAGSDTTLPANGVDVLLQGLDGAFQDPIRWDPAAPGLNRLALADVDRDGDLDVLALDGTALALRVLLNDGTGAVAPGASYSVQTGSTAPRPADLAAGDLDGDGAPEVVVANATTDQLLVFKNDGAGAFGAPVVSAALPAIGVALGDLNGDGALDVVVADGAVEILLNALDGTLAPPVTLSPTRAANAVAVADLNGDGLADLVTTNSSSAWRSATVFLQTAPGTFAAPVETFLFGHWTTPRIRTVDLDRDGDLDVVLASQSGPLLVLLNDGAGALSGPLVYPSAAGAGGLAILPGSGATTDVAVAGAYVRSTVRLHRASCLP